MLACTWASAWICSNVHGEHSGWHFRAFWSIPPKCSNVDVSWEYRPNHTLISTYIMTNLHVYRLAVLSWIKYVVLFMVANLWHISVISCKPFSARASCLVRSTDRLDLLMPRTRTYPFQVYLSFAGSHTMEWPSPKVQILQWFTPSFIWWIEDHPLHGPGL